MKLGTCDLQQHVMVVAELGNNHEGDSKLALELVEAAAEAGVDAIKVQVIDPERLVHCSQSERIAQLLRYRLPMATFIEMAAMARRKGKLFMASAFDLGSLEAIAETVAAIKIASGDLDFLPLLVKAGDLGKPILLSTGMGTLEEVRIAVETIAKQVGWETLADRLAVLHCVSLYPTPLAEVNLRAIGTFASTFNLTVGYSDHTVGIEAAVLALSQGARIIEKHFTLDKTRTSYRDHALSADPADMKRLTSVAHEFERILGSGQKEPSPAEREAAVTARRSVVAARDLPAGTHLSAADFEYVRPRNGSPPAAAAAMIGRSLRVPLRRHDLVLEYHLDA
ncbi:MAG: hypothetical protein FJ245_14665 [Nitrospira sp.]|nr:hypothetical protein [Nitrospira sp.]